jgi:hypothetical protein
VHPNSDKKAENEIADSPETSDFSKCYKQVVSFPLDHDVVEAHLDRDLVLHVRACMDVVHRPFFLIKDVEKLSIFCNRDDIQIHYLIVELYFLGLDLIYDVLLRLEVDIDPLKF